MNEYIMQHDYIDGEDILTVVSELVRCKDCKWKADTIGESWCDFHEFTILSDNDFCSYGERQEVDTPTR